MTMMTIEPNQHRFGHQSFDHMSSYPSHHAPQFTDPWATSSSSTTGSTSQSGNHNLYPSSQNNQVLPHLNLGALPRHSQHGNRIGNSASLASYASLQVTAPADLLGLDRLQPTSSSAYDTSAYTTTASPVSQTYAPSPTGYDPLGYAPAPLRGAFAIAPEDNSRRYSQQGLQPDDRRSFQDALEASHGMVSLSQDTPRNIYDVRNRGRGSNDSYGFPSAHSTNSSISSTGFSGYYSGSIDGSASDYSTTGSDIETLQGRALPRPQGLMSSQPPAPQSMMGSFSSKVSTNTQKKHKCKVCEKAFTRPSSLQTHMYSHTGEKRKHFYPFGKTVVLTNIAP
ncbi:C2H2 zinc finger protein encoded by the fle1 protein [Echria macrotheca]|uniref:C2H2 zinc finger protein encoded by the fle1 protein n=1 Tax=Echria macrotheca TaxID=438768 RepID=A0AAJ0BJB2_9PEZI|nr:C2H2 zinc finger protein encoded by the fle1 protein [Echria macrotheca]